VICDLLEVPATDRAVFHVWADELVMPASAETATAAAASLTEYLADLIAGGRERHATGLLGDLVAATDLTSEELLGMAFLILVAGHETTVDLISGTVHALTHPDRLALLRACGTSRNSPPAASTSPPARSAEADTSCGE
jgi:cytochrome P450